MATKTLHLILRAGAALTAVVLVAAVASAPRSAAAYAPETVGSESPRAPMTTTTASVVDPCPLRLPNALPNRTRVVPILMYHRIGIAPASAPAITKRLTVRPRDFAGQMRWLRNHGYRAIPQRRLFDALMCGRPLPRRSVLVTFDDGYQDNLRNASPVLARLGMRATAYVITGRTGNRGSTFLTWRQLRVLEARGVEIGSHTVSHQGLTSMSDSRALSELTQSRRALERRLGHRVPWLAYPFGDFDSRIERLARRAGYLLAVTTQWGTTQSAQRPFALPRLRVLDSTGVRGLAQMLGR